MIKKILVVDDSHVSRQILKSCIPRAEDYEIHEASDGVTGLEAFKYIRPDLTFLDITMPNMDGMDCLEEIKKVDAAAMVVMCTADMQPHNRERAASLGAFAFTVKPPTKEIIKGVLADAHKAG